MTEYFFSLGGKTEQRFDKLSANGIRI